MARSPLHTKGLVMTIRHEAFLVSPDGIVTVADGAGAEANFDTIADFQIVEPGFLLPLDAYGINYEHPPNAPGFSFATTEIGRRELTGEEQSEYSGYIAKVSDYVSTGIPKIQAQKDLAAYDALGWEEKRRAAYNEEGLTVERLAVAFLDADQGDRSGLDQYVLERTALRERPDFPKKG